LSRPRGLNVEKYPPTPRGGGISADAIWRKREETKMANINEKGRKVKERENGK
jgi:hypothetical protein